MEKNSLTLNDPLVVSLLEAIEKARKNFWKPVAFQVPKEMHRDLVVGVDPGSVALSFLCGIGFDILPDGNAPFLLCEHGYKVDIEQAEVT